MGDHIIEVRVDDKIASVVGDPLYVCGNSDYIVKFTFDSEWADHTAKTARFIKINKEYIDVIFTGDRCTMPIIDNTPYVRIGVYAGNLCTTTAATVNAQRSILCGSGTPANPPDDVYTQLMEHMDEIIASGGVSDEVITGAVRDYLDENPVTGGATAEEAAQIEANKRAIENMSPEKIGAAKADHSHTAADVGALPATYTPPVTSVNGMTGDVVIQGSGGGTAESVAWEDVTGKPSTYPPDEHAHSYNDLSDKPVIPSLTGYATETYVDEAIADAQLAGGDVDMSAYATKEYVGTAISGKVDDAELAAVAKSGSYKDLTDKPTVTNGQDGEDGVSPTVSVATITGGHRVTITDVNGSKSFDVMDGEDGATGSATPTTYAVTTTSFVNSGAITAQSVNGILKVGGYFQSKTATPTDGSTSTTICYIENVEVMGNTYAVAIDHGVSPAKAYNLLLLTEGSGSNRRTRVQFDPAKTAFPASSWMNFSIFSIIGG